MIDGVVAQVNIELITSIETMPQTKTIVSDLASASGVDSSWFVILGANSVSVSGVGSSRSLMEGSRRDTILTVGILSRNVDSQTPASNIVRYITQPNVSRYLAGWSSNTNVACETGSR